jgi:hypothetical protein
MLNPSFHGEIHQVLPSRRDRTCPRSVMQDVIAFNSDARRGFRIRDPTRDPTWVTMLDRLRRDVKTHKTIEEIQSY